MIGTDETHANATLFFNLRDRAWDAGLLAAFDLDPQLFPRALAPWAVAAELGAGVAAGLGLDAGEMAGAYREDASRIARAARADWRCIR